MEEKLVSDEVQAAIEAAQEPAVEAVTGNQRIMEQQEISEQERQGR